MLITATCKCGTKFEAEDLSALFDTTVDPTEIYTCDECYRRALWNGKKAGKKVAGEYKNAEGEE